MTCLAAVHAVLPPTATRRTRSPRRSPSTCSGDGASHEVVRRIHTNTRVGSRYLALPLDQYQQLTDFTAANDAYIEAAVELAVAGRQRRARGRRHRRRRGRRHHLHHGHRPRGAVPGGPDRRPGRLPRGHQAGAAVRPRLRRRRGRDRPAARLPARLARSRRHPAVRRAVLADHPARRHLDGQPGGQRAVRRRRRRRGRGRCRSAPIELDVGRAAGAGHPQPPLPGHRGRDGLEHRRRRIRDRADRRGARPGAPLPRAGHPGPAGGARPDRRTTSAPGCRTPAARRSSRRSRPNSGSVRTRWR